MSDIRGKKCDRCGKKFEGEDALGVRPMASLGGAEWCDVCRAKFDAFRKGEDDLTKITVPVRPSS